MREATAGAVKLGGLMLVGGLLTGGLLAMTTPTQMKHKSDDFREMIGVRDVAVSDATIPVYAPPEDLTPVHWQTASQEYPYGPPSEPYVDTTSDLMPDAADDTSAPVYPEALPQEIMDSVSPQDAMADDHAATSAQAAQAAASDVRQVESAASVDPAPVQTLAAAG